MYTRTESPLHVVQEVIDNASDEILAGFGTRIDVTLSKDGAVTVEDDGRGIPVGLHPEEKEPVVEIVFTRLHAGGKFDKRAGGAYCVLRRAARRRRLGYQRAGVTARSHGLARRQDAHDCIRGWQRRATVEIGCGEGFE